MDLIRKRNQSELKLFKKSHEAFVKGAKAYKKWDRPYLSLNNTENMYMKESR